MTFKVIVQPEQIANRIPNVPRSWYDIKMLHTKIHGADILEFMERYKQGKRNKT